MGTAIVSRTDRNHEKPVDVYIVDDDPLVLRLIDRIVSGAGYTVARFDSSVAFLNAVRPNAAHCLVLDLKMPEMDGVAVVESLLHRRQNVPVVWRAQAPRPGRTEAGRFVAPGAGTPP